MSSLFKRLLTSNLAWSAYWTPIFQSLTSQCINPCRDIRHHAISALQRALLSIELISGDDKDWTSIFDQVLFPLVLRLLKPETYHSDPLGMSETRVQAATLVCKIFLRYLDQHPNQDAMLDLWLRILDILDRMMNSGQGDSLVRFFRSFHLLSSRPNFIAGGSYPRKPEKHPSGHGRWRPLGPPIPRRKQGANLD